MNFLAALFCSFNCFKINFDGSDICYLVCAAVEGIIGDCNGHILLYSGPAGFFLLNNEEF